jgi:hypothetical protein
VNFVHPFGALSTQTVWDVCCGLQVAEAQSLLANTTSLVEQQLQLPAKSCAVITNGRVVMVHDPKQPENSIPGKSCLIVCICLAT